MKLFMKLLKFVSIVCHALTIIGVVVGTGLFLVTLTSSKGAPQEAAGAAMSLCFAILPYCFARSIDGIKGNMESR